MTPSPVDVRLRTWELELQHATALLLSLNPGLNLAISVRNMNSATCTIEQHTAEYKSLAPANESIHHITDIGMLKPCHAVEARSQLCCVGTSRKLVRATVDSLAGKLSELAVKIIEQEVWSLS
eukprot:4071807-Pyramimonas_sp.AAC.1